MGTGAASCLSEAWSCLRPAGAHCGQVLLQSSGVKLTILSNTTLSAGYLSTADLFVYTQFGLEVFPGEFIQTLH